ncbi:MAG: hypothetical protein QW512_04590 [Thermofilaceae archaeon]
MRSCLFLGGLLKKLRGGLDIGDLILRVLAQELKLDPEEISEARLELASRFLKRPIYTSRRVKRFKHLKSCMKLSKSASKR